MSDFRSNQKRQRTAPLAVGDLLVVARLMWRKDPCNARSTGTEDRDFREYFGCNVLNALIIWNMLCNLDYLPESGSHHHFLWALCYLKQYPKTRAMCTICGGIDPATMRKWVWQFISAIACLELHVVSYPCAYSCTQPLPTSVSNVFLSLRCSVIACSCRLYGKTDCQGTKGMTVWYQLMGLIVEFQTMVHPSLATSLPRKEDSDMKLPCVFLPVI